MVTLYRRLPKFDYLGPKTIDEAKEASEGSCCTAPPAVINAIYNATGVWIKDLPAQPEKVF